jgi:hypothetical protein
MKKAKAGLIVPILIILVGVAWLLNTLQVLPGVDWMWTGGLGVCGVLILAVGGVNKLTFTVGPFLLLGSILSVLRQTGRLSIDIEMPVLFILFGVLLFLAHVLPLPTPEFLQPEDPAGKK